VTLYIQGGRSESNYFLCSMCVAYYFDRCARHIVHVLQRVAACRSVSQRVAPWCIVLYVLQCVAACCSVLQRVELCCSVLQCDAVC